MFGYRANMRKDNLERSGTDEHDVADKSRHLSHSTFDYLCTKIHARTVSSIIVLIAEIVPVQ